MDFKIVEMRIKKRREALGLTQEELGRGIEGKEISKKTIWRWENGERELKAGDIQRVAHALDCSVAYLMGETDNPNARAPQVEAPQPEEEQERQYPSTAHRLLDRLVRKLSAADPDFSLELLGDEQTIEGLSENDARLIAQNLKWELERIRKKNEEGENR